MPESETAVARSISLTNLLEKAINTTYAELQICMEKMPKMGERERKVPFLQFTHGTHVRFLKLYALVRWLKTWQQFDQLNRIDYFLEDVNDQFAESFDVLRAWSSEIFPFLG